MLFKYLPLLTLLSLTTAQTVSQKSDGQPQAPSAASKVSQISDGQIQAPTPTKPSVSQISDGQIQAPGPSSTSLPQVDLGYEIHKAISYNATGQTYNFTNIRYAQPPVGKLRFAPPVPPAGRNPVVQDGREGRVCPQASPAWGAIAGQFVTAVLTGKDFNYTAAVASLSAAAATSTAAPFVDGRTTEDCLFLDVIVPKTTFDKARLPKANSYGKQGAPVLLWIYGGGYTAGDKNTYNSGNPSGLIKASQYDQSEGIIFVAINYRLGALGWLSGPSVQSTPGLVSQPGLYDQRLAIQWVHDNIALFGGDPSRITLIGESAGGGSIMHQITAFGGTQGVSFSGAIPQSPGFAPVYTAAAQENVTQDFLQTLGVNNVADAQALTSAQVIAANTKQISSAPYGSYYYGPVVDGVFAPALPGQLLLAGKFAKNVHVMVGHNADEGLLFTPPFVNSAATYTAFIQSRFPTISPTQLNFLLTQLYPEDYSGAYGYKTPLQRTIVTISESIFTCNTNYLDRAYANATFAYEFAVPPALHGEDIAYTFYNGDSSVDGYLLPLNVTIAKALQQYLTNFAKAFDPNPGVGGTPPFPIYGPTAQIQTLNVTGVYPMRDEASNPRCLWWQQALYE